MDRMLVYPGQLPLETDILSTNKYAMMGIAKLAEAVFGTSGVSLVGLPCTPGTGLNVSVGAGQMYRYLVKHKVKSCVGTTQPVNGM